jgi:hypothetical protein
MAEAVHTTNHEAIRAWIEARGGRPAKVKGAGGPGDLLRVDFPGYSGGESLEEISWEEFFDEFEKNRLAFLYQDEDDSRFSKFIRR